MLAVALLLAGGAVTTFDEAAWRAGIEKERAGFRAFLRESPTSYFAAAGRTDFGSAAALVVGRAPDCGVRIDDPEVRPHHLRVAVQGDAFRVEALDEGAAFRLDQDEVREATTGPASLRLGRFTLRLSHQRFPAIIVFDPRRLADAPAAEPRWWPPDPSWRVTATLVPAPRAEERVVLSTRGVQRRVQRLGRFEFSRDGRRLALEAVRFLEPGVGENDVSVLFRDATTGRDSYPVGRYLEPVRQPDGTWVLDFNAASNPACAWSPHYNCPIPPKENVLPVAVEAGERVPAGH